MPLQFFDVDDFKVINAKFSLDMALAFFNANALMWCFASLPPVFKSFEIRILLSYLKANCGVNWLEYFQPSPQIKAIFWNYIASSSSVIEKLTRVQ